MVRWAHDSDMTTTATSTYYPIDVSEPLRSKDFDAYGTRYPVQPRDRGYHTPTHRWTKETMTWVIAAVKGQKVLIEIDGLAWSGCELVGMSHVPGYNTSTVIIRRFHTCAVEPLPDGRTRTACRPSCRGHHDTAYPIRDVGVIVPQTAVWLDRGAKWRALDIARRETAANAIAGSDR